MRAIRLNCSQVFLKAVTPGYATEKKLRRLIMRCKKKNFTLVGELFLPTTFFLFTNPSEEKYHLTFVKMLKKVGFRKVRGRFRRCPVMGLGAQGFLRLWTLDVQNFKEV